jgi:hypothetical protein
MTAYALTRFHDRQGDGWLSGNVVADVGKGMGLTATNNKG